ncbi:TPA: oligosaccharide flippase family protein, partial [Klebsiella pneumoniae]|nr:oligosaccharide flippase family protein [Klebsiella pneumoniae]
MNKKALSNSIWMMSEKIISIFGLIFVTSYVAKYVGPSIYGEIMYATTIFQIAQVASQLGSDVVIFKRISKNHISGIKLINATLPIRVIIYLIIAVPTLLMMDLNNFGRGFYFSIACFIAGFFS